MMPAGVLIIGDGSRRPVARAAEELAGRLSGRAQLAAVHLTLAEPPPEVEASLAVVLGGDGSMLCAARLLAPRGVPMAGVNFGKFGFLASFSMAELEAELPEMLSGVRQASEWMMLRVETEGAAGRFQSLALNDVVLTGAKPTRMVHITLDVAGELVTTYAGDGLTVSTPAGSTAYSLSAGGPIVNPALDALVVTPICAHSLSDRPLVVPPDALLSITLAGRAQRGILTADGQDATFVARGQAVRVTGADVRARVFMTATRSYYQTLRDKLGWGGQPNYVPGSGVG